MNINWTEAGAIVITGLIIVFAALIILIALVMLMGKIMRSAALPGRKDTGRAAQPAAVTATAPPLIEDGIDAETVAVITAAAACMMQESAPGAVHAVTSIRRGRDARPVWGFAGMQQNTRPF